MRLIDADKAEANFKKLMGLPDDYVGPSDITVHVDSVFSFFGQQADVDPVKHGYWKHTTSYSWGPSYDECSYCHRALFNYRAERLPRYCPHCGAKMDGVKNETD